MPDLWMPGALRIESARRNTLNGNGFRLLTWHTFEAKYSLSVEAGLRYLINNGSEAFVFHPITGQWGQCQPMNTGARTLKSATNVPTNKFGTVHQQVEVIAYAANPWTNDLTDAGRAGLKRGLDFFRSWGIPDQWAWRDQPPPRYPGGSVRRRAPEQSGHAYHSGWPVNDHGDPGAIAAPWTLTAPPQEVTMLTSLLVSGARAGETRSRGPEVTLLQQMLNALRGAGLDTDGSFGPATEAAVKAYQAAKGIAADGRVGPDTRSRLNADWAAYNAPKPPPAPTPAPAPAVTLADVLAAVQRVEAKVDALAPKETTP